MAMNRGCFWCTHFKPATIQQEVEPSQQTGWCEDPSKQIHPMDKRASGDKPLSTSGFMTCSNWMRRFGQQD